jgi:hypothetical protein
MPHMPAPETTEHSHSAVRTCSACIMLIWMRSHLSVFFWYRLAYAVMLQSDWKRPFGKFTHIVQYNIQIHVKIRYYFIEHNWSAQRYGEETASCLSELCSSVVWRGRSMHLVACSAYIVEYVTLHFAMENAKYETSYLQYTILAADLKLIEENQ